MTQSFVLSSAPPPRSRRWTPLLLTQLAVVLVVMLTAVASAGVLRGREGGTDVLSVVKSASAAAAAQPTFRSTMTFRVTGSGVDITTKSDSLVDTVSGLSSGTVQFPGVPDPLKVVSSGNVFFAQLPNGRTDAAGKHWLSFSSPQGAASLGTQDPLQMLALIGEPDKVETVGEEDVRGVATTHYRVPLDADRLTANMAKSGSGVMVPSGALDQLRDTSFDLWVDGNNLPRKMTMAFEISKIKSDFALEILDYGQPVTVTLPNASDVTTATSSQDFGMRLQQALTP